MSIIEKALENRNLSSESMKLYKRNLIKLNDNKPIKNFNFLKNIDNVLNIISKLKATTQRSYIISICSILRDIPKFKKIYNQYFEILKKSNNDLKDNTDKSMKQKENWLSQEQVMKIYEDKKNEILNKIGKKRKIDDFDDLTNFMILSLYTLIQPRRNRDYTLMKVSNNTIDDNFNYLVIEKDKLKFILNKYKTDKKYNSIIIEIPEKLKEIIYLYLKFHPKKNELKNNEYSFYFLVNKDGDNFKNSNEITKRLNKIFNQKISSSMLRNIFLTNKYSDVMNELKTDTNAMGTSIDVAMNNYIKKD
jgi:hypothetical protein